MAIGGSTSFISNTVQNHTVKAVGKNVISKNNTSALFDIANKYRVNTNVNANNTKQVGDVWVQTNQKIRAEIKTLRTNSVSTELAQTNSQQIENADTKTVVADVAQVVVDQAADHIELCANDFIAIIHAFTS